VLGKHIIRRIFGPTFPLVSCAPFNEQGSVFSLLTVTKLPLKFAAEISVHEFEPCPANQEAAYWADGWFDIPLAGLQGIRNLFDCHATERSQQHTKDVAREWILRAGAKLLHLLREISLRPFRWRFLKPYQRLQAVGRQFLADETCHQRLALGDSY